MGVIGFIISLVAVVFLLISLIPVIGWWISAFVTLPLSIIAAAFSGFGVSRRTGGIAIAGLIISAIVFFFAITRLVTYC